MIELTYSQTPSNKGALLASLLAGSADLSIGRALAARMGSAVDC